MAPMLTVISVISLEKEHRFIAIKNFKKRLNSVIIIILKRIHYRFYGRFLLMLRKKLSGR